MPDTQLKLKDHIRETRIFTSRVIVAGVGVALLILVILLRMVYLQVVSHEHFTTLSQNNRVNIVPVPPTRGLIFDRNGEVLAQNLPSFSLELVPEKITDIDATIEALKEFITLSNQDIEQFRKARKRARAFQSLPLRFRLQEEEVLKARFIPIKELRTHLTDEQTREKYCPASALLQRSLISHIVISPVVGAFG